jgi:hypothetical protein
MRGRQACQFDSSRSGMVVGLVEESDMAEAMRMAKTMEGRAQGNDR